MATKVIINADDFGYSRAVNFGIIDSHLNGVLTSATLMANMPGFEHAVELAKANPKFGVGVHMVLTCERPLLDTHTQIVDETGAFCRQPKYRDGSISMSDKLLQEIELEWTAQIEKVLAAGIMPTHLDSHHHMHLQFAETTEIAVKLSRKYKLPLRVFLREVPADIIKVETFEEKFDNIGEEAMSAEEVLVYYSNVLEKIKTTGSIEIMTHPAYLDEQVVKGSSLNLARIYEVSALCTSSFSEAIKNDPSIILSTYRDL
ncbi:chito-oligosaccharide deacetylase [Erysipelotrichaceae bacterium]|nr:chito-oligosaccharide deacetylase [Erysipelotrichaceae bacterium]